MTLLIVDDLLESLTLLQHVLAGNGFTVLTARDGGEALERARRERPDLIVTDIMMPMMDGFSLCRAVKADPELRRIPVVFYTATYTDAEDEELALALGAARFIRKPADPGRFVATIREVIEERETGALEREPPKTKPAAVLQLYNARLVAKLEKKLGELHALEERFRLVTENMVDAVFTIDKDGHFTYANRAAETLSGYSLKEYPEITFRDLLSAASLEVANDRLRRAFAGDNVMPYFEAQCLRKDGRTIPVELMVTSVWKEGRVVERLGVARDISGRREIQVQLIQTEKLSALGLMLSGVAHELNNPLSIMLAYSELLLKNAVTDQPEKALNAIHRAAIRATRVVNGLLSFARQRSPERAWVAVSDLLDQCVELLSYQLRADDIVVEKLYGTGLPRLPADPHQLQQVFINLLTNAHQALREVRPPRFITLRSAGSHGEVQIIVADNGPGIAAEIIGRIFDPFFTTKPAGGGTGLGLSVCFGIVKEHGGRIEVESAPGRGATFTVTLPVGGAMAAHREAPVTTRAKVTRQAVAVIDDEPEIGQALGAVLTALGHQVTVYGGGDEALSELRSGRFDLIFLDVRMPGLDGPAIYRMLRSHDPKLAQRVVFLTGDRVNPEAQAFIAATKNPCLLKPFSYDDVSEIVGKAITSTPASGGSPAP